MTAPTERFCRARRDRAAGITYEVDLATIGRTLVESEILYMELDRWVSYACDWEWLRLYALELEEQGRELADAPQSGTHKVRKWVHPVWKIP